MLPVPTPEEIEICNRKLTKSDAEGFCKSMHLCFEYNEWVRCGPCSLAREAAHPTNPKEQV